jgi:hypothetical protein
MILNGLVSKATALRESIAAVSAVLFAPLIKSLAAGMCQLVQAPSISTRRASALPALVDCARSRTEWIPA